MASLTSCALLDSPAEALAKNDEKTFSQALRAPKTINGPILGNESIDSNSQLAPSRLNIRKAPSLSVKQQAAVANTQVLPNLDESSIIERLSFNNMPLASFINEVFGNQLGLSFIIEPRIASAEDLVTMRLQKPLNQQELYRVATQTIAPYGVTTSLNDEVLTFSFSEEASARDTPLLVSGRALPDTPQSSRPLFFVYPIKFVNAGNIINYIKQLFSDNELKVTHDLFTNSLIFQGNHNKVEQGVAAANVFDVPEMAGMQASIISPVVSTVTELANNLENILQSEGFFVGDSRRPGVPIKILPLESSGQLIVFARSVESIRHIENWVKAIEIEKQSDIKKGFFSYPVQSTLATHIVEVLGGLGVTNYISNNNDSENNQARGGNGSVASNSATRNNSRRIVDENTNQAGQYTVDEQLNTILFSGSGEEWLKVLPIIQKLDRPSPSVLVEVILVEVQLNDSEESGVEWLANASLDDFSLGFGTLGNLGINGSGLNLFGLDSAGNTRAAINAFYKNDRAKIRSRPRIMVKSGGEASIDVGNEIPVITSTSQSTQDANAPTVQNVTYRKTGVILDIKPTVHASGFVDIEINQELSEQTDSSAAGNPVILNRSLSTTVTLRDGGSVLIGGLISSTSGEGQQGVPLLGKLPLVGKLFRTDTTSTARTELMIMIIPYILNNPAEAESLTDELQLERIRLLNNN